LNKTKKENENITPSAQFANPIRKLKKPRQNS